MFGRVLFHLGQRRFEVITDAYHVGARVGAVFHLRVKFLLNDGFVEPLIGDDDDLTWSGG